MQHEEALKEALRRKGNRPFPAFDGPVVYCRVRAPSLNVYSKPSCQASVVGKKHDGEMVVIQNDGVSADTPEGWLVLIDWTDSSAKWLCPGEGLLPLPYATLEVMEYIRAGWAFEIGFVERLLSERVGRMSQNRTCQSQLLEFGRLPDFFSNVFPRCVAYKADSELMVSRDPGPGNVFHVRSARLIRRGELVEACRIMPLQSSPGPVLAPLSVVLGSSSEGAERKLGLPLGYASLCQRGVGVTGLQCNVQTSLQEGCKGGHVLLVHASADIHPAQEIVFPTPEAAGEPFIPQAPPAKERKRVGQPLGGFEAVTSGKVKWSESPLHGVGVFASAPFSKDSILEICPVLVLDDESKRAAADYCMHIEAYCSLAPSLDLLALGTGALYNHQDESAEHVSDWWYDHSLGVIAIVARTNIRNGAEVFIDYGENYWLARKPADV